jgi:regulatory protein
VDAFKIRLDCGINMAVTQEPRRPPTPLDTDMLQRLALNYAGRYATTRAKLRSYLTRKLRERGWSGQDAPPIETLVERMSMLGYVDDRGFADARGAALTRRGYGIRRVADALRAAGIGEEDARDAQSNARSSAWDAALAFARRRRIGPFATERVAAGPQREKLFGALIRAGHSFEIARILVESSPGEIPEDPN